jgi:hypothetical protein
MAAALPSASFSSSSLTRLLTTLSAVEVPAPAVAPQTLAERLGLWLNWTDAIALSAALNATGMAGQPAAADVAAFDECKRLRAALALSLDLYAARVAGAARPATQTPVAARAEDNDFSPYRRAYLAQQRAMESAAAALRVKLRAALSAHSPALARLAALDEAMEAALRPQERHLLATVPEVLERHFDRVRQAPSAPWLDRYAADMQAVLRAEGALRLQAIDGLLETLQLALEAA